MKIRVHYIGRPGVSFITKASRRATENKINQTNMAGRNRYQQMAADDLPYINKYKSKIIAAANKYNLPPSDIAAIISRETRGGRGAGLSSDGWGDNGNAYGLMQIDKRWHKPKGEWDSQEHIEQGAKILVDCYSDVRRKFPHLSKDQTRKGALAAYNMGAERMDPNNVDAHTTGGDYSTDVDARAQYFKQNGY